MKGAINPSPIRKRQQTGQVLSARMGGWDPAPDEWEARLIPTDKDVNALGPMLPQGGEPEEMALTQKDLQHIDHNRPHNMKRPSPKGSDPFPGMGSF